jgi:hypothetical protein
MGKSNMNQTQFVTEVYEVAWSSNPDLDHSSSFQDVLKELRDIKDKALRMDILTSSFKPEPELFPVTNSILNKERRQGQL